ncbi:MAG TPA: VWA domain-containing protein [Streptosporangiaceae bacterium]|nr:VWA domain-containing protein [Streptosporangiaceae bacterium]
MQGLLATLVDELRSVGIGVSVGEHLDAAEALSRISLFDKDVVRAALLSTLVKRAEHVETFNLVFELVMASPGDGDASLVEAMSDEQLSDALRHAVEAGDRQLIRLLADEFVRRFGGLEPGRPVAGVFATIAVNQAADLEGIRASLLESGESPVQAEGFGGSGGGSGSGAGSGSGSAGFRARLADARADRGVTDVRAELRAAVRRALVADRGAQAVRETMRVELPEDMDIVTASAAEQRAMAAAIGPLAQRLTYVLARLAVRRRTLSIRRTMQRAMGTGGVPFRLVTEPARPPRPEIVVLADMSGSVAAFSRFTLDLLVALDSRLNRFRVFSFVDGVADITELVREARGAGRRLSAREAARDAVRWSGSSDYGYVMREFAREFAPRLTRRSVVLVVGDARSNYGDPRVEAFRDICERAGRVYWLNPEPRRFWNEGDSVIGRYAPLCAQVRECRTLGQIADFVESLTVGSGRTSPEGRMR